MIIKTYMNKIQNVKIKNPLLKQIGKNDIIINKESTEKKVLNLEVLLEYVKNLSTKNSTEINITVENNSSINNVNEDNILLDINIEPKFGEFIELKISEDNLHNIIDGISFKRFGVLKSVPGKLKFYNNLSLLSSLIIAMNDKLIATSEESFVNYVKSTKTYIYNIFNKTFYDQHKYKDLAKTHNFDRLEISKNLHNFEISRNELLVISDIFHINIFILDTKKDKLFFTGVKFIPYKKNIFLLKKDDGFYEPLYLDNKFYIEHDNDFVQYLLENSNLVELYFKNDKNTFDISLEDFDFYNNYIEKEVKLDIKNKILERRLYNLNKTEVKEENIDNNDNNDNKDNNNDKENELDNDYTENKNMPEYNIATEIKSLSDSDADDSSDTDDSSDEEIVETAKYNKTELKNMKVNEIILIAKSLNISVECKKDGKVKKKTKVELIEEIIKT